MVGFDQFAQTVKIFIKNFNMQYYLFGGDIYYARGGGRDFIKKLNYK